MNTPEKLSGVIPYHILACFILRRAVAVKTGIAGVEVSGIMVILNDSEHQN